MSVEDNEDTLPATKVATRGSATTVTGSGAHADGAEVQPGDLISDRYQLIELLGEGGMGRVFLALDQLYAKEFEDRQAHVAIKFLGLRFATHSVARMALQREARKSQQLSHPNVVRVLHFDQHRGLPYMIMEFMRGQPLDDFLREHCRGGLPLDRALPLIEGMASGLDYIHAQGLIHSDFKPNNVFVGEDGAAKILDLGIARAREDALEGAEQTRFNASDLGAMTPAYASCEMFEGLTPDPRDDVYALACVSYELLAGQHPFARQPAIKARAEGLQAPPPGGLDKSRWRALKRGLAFNRDERTASARELLESLRGKGKRREVLLASLGVLALVLAAVAWVLGQSVSGPDPQTAFLDSLSPAQLPAVSEADARRIEGWLEQGQAYLEIARQEYASGDLDTALHIMSGGADNAFRAFDNVLKRTRSAPARQGVVDMLDTYAQWAQRASASGDAEATLRITCHGLKVYPGSETLGRLQREASEAVAATRASELTTC